MRRQGLLAFVIVGALALVLVGGWYVFAYHPISGEIASANATIAQDTTAVTTEQAELSSLMVDKRHATVLKRELASLEQALPQQFSLAQFITMADQVAASASVPLLQISPSQPGSGTQVSGVPAGVQAIAFTAEARGGYFQIMHLLHGLDHLPEVVSLSSLQLQSSSASGATQVTLQLSGEVFYRGSAASGGGKEAS